MGEKGKVLGIVGSPNRNGRTSQLVAAVFKGAARAGNPTELVQMVEYDVAACKDCLPWVCKDNLKCTYEDEGFEYLSRKILNCSALVLGTPVYSWDTSASVKYLFLKMIRAYANSGPLRGVPAAGIAIAGGSGNGLVSALRPLYHFFQMMQMRAADPIPATRFNYDRVMKQLDEFGVEFAAMADKRLPFNSLEDRLLWYDGLPYLNLNRTQERRLLAEIAVQASSVHETDALNRADDLASKGSALASLVEVIRAYETAAKSFK